MNCPTRAFLQSDGFILTVAGNGLGAGTDRGSFSGDNGLASQAGLNTPEGVAVDPSGDFYIADTENYRIRKVTATDNVITTIAGTGADGFSGDGGQASQATMNLPWSVALDAGDQPLTCLPGAAHQYGCRWHGSCHSAAIRHRGEDGQRKLSW